MMGRDVNVDKHYVQKDGNWYEYVHTINDRSGYHFIASCVLYDHRYYLPSFYYIQEYPQKYLAYLYVVMLKVFLI
jgi:hypothetical protein